MTVTNTDNKDQVLADGVRTLFPFSFRVDRTQDFQVWFDEVEQTYGSSYQIEDELQLGDETGGNVEVNSVLVDEVVVTIMRVVVIDQQTDYTPYDSFPAEIHELALDHGIMIDQQFDERFSRVLQYPVSYDPLNSIDIPEYEANNVLGWSSITRELANFGINLSGTPVGVIPVIATSGYASLNEAVTDIGSTPATLMFDKTLPVTATLETPITLKLWFPTLGYYVEDTIANADLSILGPVEAELFKIFDWGNGTGILTGRAQKVYPEWFGALGNGVTDDYAAFVLFVAFINSGTFEVTQTYVIDLQNPSFDMPSNCTLQGGGKILWDVGAAPGFTGEFGGGDLFDWDTKSGITIKNITIEETSMTAENVNHVLGIKIADCEDIKISNVLIQTSQLSIRTSENIVVNNVIFKECLYQALSLNRANYATYSNLVFDRAQFIVDSISYSDFSGIEMHNVNSGFKIQGDEGDAKDVTFSNITMFQDESALDPYPQGVPSSSYIAISNLTAGTRVDNITFDNIKIYQSAANLMDAPIFRMRLFDDADQDMTNIHFRNIYVNKCTEFLFIQDNNGGQNFRDIDIENIVIDEANPRVASKGVILGFVDAVLNNINMNNITVNNALEYPLISISDIITNSRIQNIKGVSSGAAYYLVDMPNTSNSNITIDGVQVTGIRGVRLRGDNTFIKNCFVNVSGIGISPNTTGENVQFKDNFINDSTHINEFDWAFNRFSMKTEDAESGTLTGATDKIEINVPEGSLILGVTMNNQVAVTNDGDNTYTAAFSGGLAVAINGGAAIAAAQNTKTKEMFDVNAAAMIVASSTDITLTPQAADFTGGNVRAVVWYKPPPDDLPDTV